MVPAPIYKQDMKFLEVKTEEHTVYRDVRIQAFSIQFSHVIIG